MSAPVGFFGIQGLHSSNGDYNASQFQIDQSLRRLRTAIPVKVTAVSGGGLGAPPIVQVIPLVNQIDGIGNQTPHGEIFNIPCVRNQGGGNAIINDPTVGDIGYMMVSDRDISSVKASAGQANPGSRRIHNLADGVYMGAMLMSGPNQAVQFTATGVKIFDKNGNIISMEAGQILVTGNLHVTGEIIAGYGGSAVNLQTHTHAQGNDSANDAEMETNPPTVT